MANRIEVFSAGCPLCEDAVRQAGGLGEVDVVDIRSADGAQRARQYGIARVPAVVVDGRLGECCQQQQAPISIDALRRQAAHRS